MAPSTVFQSPVKTFVLFFFSNEVMNDQSSSHTFCLPPSFEKKNCFLEKKKGSVILISTIILLNLTFSLINYRKGASTIYRSSIVVEIFKQTKISIPFESQMF